MASTSASGGGVLALEKTAVGAEAVPKRTGVNLSNQDRAFGNFFQTRKLQAKKLPSIHMTACQCIRFNPIAPKWHLIPSMQLGCLSFKVSFFFSFVIFGQLDFARLFSLFHLHPGRPCKVCDLFLRCVSPLGLRSLSCDFK